MSKAAGAPKQVCLQGKVPTWASTWVVTFYALVRELTILDRVEAEALAAGVVSEADLVRWHQGLESAEAKATFFASLSLVLVAGRKP